MLKSPDAPHTTGPIDPTPTYLPTPTPQPRHTTGAPTLTPTRHQRGSEQQKARHSHTSTHARTKLTT